MKGKIIITSKTQAQSTKELFPALYMPGAQTFFADTQAMKDSCKFGVAITPSSCYELSQMEASKRSDLLKHIYGKDGLGLSIGRLCIGSSDYSPEIYSYDDVSFDTELRHFSVERDEKYIIPIVQEILEINPDLYLFASPWSPPFWMKTGGSMCGGYMRDEFLDCYANYIVKFIQAYAERGIKISAITPQNEPETQQKNQMPACIWHPQTEAAFITLLKKKFKENSLDIKVWMHDHNFQNVQRVIWSLENYERLSESCDGVAFHYYSGTIEQTKEVANKFPALELHFTEGGPRLTDNYETDWCKWGLMAVKAMKLGYRSFTGWNLMLDETGGPNVGPFIGICGGFVTQNHQTEELIYSGQYRAFSHISPYITDTSGIYPIVSKESSDFRMGNYPKYSHKIEGVVIDNQDQKMIAILVNPNKHGVQAQITLCETTWYLELPEDSISTVIVEV